jgi:hypothetical protein
MNRVQYDNWRANKQNFALNPALRAETKRRKDVIYIWEAIGLKRDGLSVFKIGITSASLRKSRIARCAKNHGLEYRLIAYMPCDKTKEVERAILAYGKPVPMYGDAGTEFRAMTGDDLERVLSLAAGYCKTDLNGAEYTHEPEHDPRQVTENRC